jgi:hypothetical protein
LRVPSLRYSLSGGCCGCTYYERLISLLSPTGHHTHGNRTRFRSGFQLDS